MWRRDVLRLGLTALAMTVAGGCGRGRRRGSPRQSRELPRHVVILALGGGIDPVWTTDPKSPAEVEPGIDVPYSPSEIVDAGGLRLGPHFAPLARWAPRMAVVNGVQIDTANHPTGYTQLARLRTRAHVGMPTILDVIGRHREGPPLGCISFGQLDHRTHSSGFVDGNLLCDEVERRSSSPGDFEAVAHVLAAQARRVAGPTPERTATAENLRAAAAFFERLPHVPSLPTTTGPMPLDHVLGRTHWVLDNDLARCVFVGADKLGWDSHNHNRHRQASISGPFVAAFGRFLDALAASPGRAGTSLLDDTLIVALSEIGRFPRLNGNDGKDHFPELPCLLIGAGIDGGGAGGTAYGLTGRQMQALPVSLRTGRPSGAGDRPLRLDDVGATVLHLAGITPSVYGYDGEILGFLA